MNSDPTGSIKKAAIQVFEPAFSFFLIIQFLWHMVCYIEYYP